MSQEHLSENEVVAFFAGALEAPEVDRVELHVDGCDRCRAWLSAAAGGSPNAVRPLVATSLALGELVADRYEISRFIGAGGMGEVYEAFDKLLSMPVALKTVRLDLAADGESLGVVRRELSLARQVTHPNVSRVHDVGLHRANGLEIPFFTMELLTGETLAQRLAREGKLSPEVAGTLLAQLAHGLDAAHAVGVLHRDLKSHNVFLRQDASGATQAVLTDFGLARSSREDAARATGSAGLLGTPAYMAPEQVAGEPVGPAADFYALGVVAFEMVSGKLPFHGPTALATASLRLTQPAPDLRALVPDLPQTWASAVAALLQRSPAARPRSGAELLAQLRGDRPAAGRPRSNGRFFALAAAAVLASTAGVVLYLQRKPNTPAPAPTPDAAARRRVLAVLPLKSLTPGPEARWLADAASQLLSAELTATQDVRSVPPDVLAGADPKLSDASELSEASLDALRKAVGADFVLAGALTALGEGEARTVRLDVRLYDAALGTPVATASGSGAEKALLTWISSVSDKLRPGLSASAPSAADSAAARALLPATLPAARAYAEGRRALAAVELTRARERFEEVVKLEPQFAPGQAALSKTLLALGARAPALAAAERAFQLSAGLPREERAVIEALYRSNQRDWKRAIEIYKSLWTLYPDNLQHGLQLARAQQYSGALKDGLATLERFRALEGPDRDDPRVTFEIAELLQKMNDFPRAQAEADRAATQAELRGLRLLAARARMTEAEVLTWQSKRDEALAKLEVAARIFEESSDSLGVAMARLTQGHVLRDRGDLDGAFARYKEAEALDRKLGEETNLAAALTSQAVIWRRRGKPEQALALNEEALALNRRNQVMAEVGVNLQNMARCLEDLDRLEEAQKLFEEVVTLTTELGERGMRVRALGNLGMIAASRGRLAEGRKAFEDILTTIDEIGEPALKAGAFDILIGLIGQQGKVSEARALMEQREKLSVEFKLEDELRLSQTRGLLAYYAGDFPRSEQQLGAAIAGWTKQGSAADELEARDMLLTTLLAAGEKARAQEALELLEQRASNPSAKEVARQGRARFEAQLGDARKGLTALEVLLAEKPAAALRYELTLSHAAARARLGQKAQARKELTELLEQTQRDGFGHLSARAQAVQAKL